MRAELAFISWPMAVIGLGVTGSSVLRLLKLAGVPDALFTSLDDRDSKAQYQDPQQLLTEFKPKCICVSPGYPLSTPWIQQFLKQGGQLTSELDIAHHFLTTEKVVAITGSLGKSTSISLVKYALDQLSPEGFTGGNLGIPLADYICQKLTGRTAAPWVALELSSYQLENFAALSCQFSAITYLTANHLERYPSKQQYYAAKWELCKKTTATVVMNRNGGDLIDYLSSHPVPKSLITDRTSTILQKYNLLEPKLLGSHNLDNLALAATLLELMQVDAKLIESLKSFAGLPHRVENLGLINGVLYVNDSKATTMESVLTAVQSSIEKLQDTQKLYLLLGGKDKNLPWAELNALKKNHRLQFIFFGECGSHAKTLSALQGPVFESLSLATKWAIQQAKVGDIVLLSPGGTSLDEFKNFEERGLAFSQLVNSQNNPLE